MYLQVSVNDTIFKEEFLLFFDLGAPYALVPGRGVLYKVGSGPLTEESMPS